MPTLDATFGPSTWLPRCHRQGCKRARTNDSLGTSAAVETVSMVAAASAVGDIKNERRYRLKKGLFVA